MNGLKIFVERVVRPVMADTWTKLRMREELYTHASEVYALELARDHNEQDALARTIARLGDPAALTAEYQSAVPSTEWFTAWFTDRFFRQRQQESRLGLAARIAAYNLLVGGGLMLLLLLPQVPELVTWSIKAQLKLRLCLGLLVSWTADVFVLTLLASAMRDELLSGVGVARRVWRCGLLAVAAALTIELSGWVFMFVAGGSPVGWGRLPLAAVIGLGCVLGAWLTAHERRGSDPWTSLEIEG